MCVAQLYDLCWSFNIIHKYITGDHILILSYIFLGLISSTFVSYLYGLMRRILCLILSHHTIMWPCHWSNTALSQMGPYMDSLSVCRAIIEHGFIFDFGSPGQLFYYFLGLYLNLFTLDFVDVLIPNPSCIYRENYITANYQLARTKIFKAILCRANFEHFRR